VTKTKTYRIVVLPGDGIGPEIVDAALDVLETVQKVAGGFSLACEFHKAGAACYRDTGEAITPEALEAFRNADATLKGPVGLPDVRKPDGTEAGLLGGILRVGFDLYANVRPIVDAAAAALVSRPRHFQVIVTENLFGDILSDLGGATIGGLGMCPSANIGECRAYFEPIHGSAPDIAGRSLANPVSQIMSAAMMLDHLGEATAAAMLEAALWKVYAQHGIPFKTGGEVEGGASIVATAVKLALKAF
jgi:isocitrate/isopropylmalate dehydrogenase